MTCSKEYPLEHRSRGEEGGRGERQGEEKEVDEGENGTKRQPLLAFFINITDTAHMNSAEAQPRRGGVFSSCDSGLKKELTSDVKEDSLG